jgi:large subunit ribosomal protein L29
VKAKDFRGLTDEELSERLHEHREAIRNFRFQLATSSVDNSRGIRNARRDVARIKTVLRERELEREQAK